MGPAGGGPAHQQVAVVPRAGGGGARGPDAAAPHPVPVLQGPSPYIIIIISGIVIIVVIGGQWTDAQATLQLTHLLRDSLGGNCKTLLIANLRGELEQVRPPYIMIIIIIVIIVINIIVVGNRLTQSTDRSID